MIHLVHGFNVGDGGKKTTDKLRPHFEAAGFSVREFDYGWLGLLGVRLFNGHIAQRLTELVADGDIGVGHSNGCAILARAADDGAPFTGLVFLNPALNSDRIIAPQVKWIQVYHTAHDLPVRIARWLPFHQWGDMGARGFTGNDLRYTNINLSDKVSAHSGIFRHIGTWGPVIAGNVKIALWG